MTRLDDLSNELLENIAEYLELQDLCNLRCVSREICHKASQRKYQSYFRRKRVYLTRDGLQDFAWATSEGRFGRLIKDLTLVGIVPASEDLDFRTMAEFSRKPLDKTLHPSNRLYQEWQSDLKNGIALDCLQTTLSRIGGNYHGLDRLCLDLIMDAPRAEDRVFRVHYRRTDTFVAAEMCTLVLAALQKSKIGVITLELFCCEPDSSQWRLPTDVLRETFLHGNDDDASCLSSVRRLATSVGHPCSAAEVTAQDADGLPKVLDSGTEHDGLAALLRLCNDVEELLVFSFKHFEEFEFPFYMGPSDQRGSIARLLPLDVHQCAEYANPPSLRSVCLDNLNAEIADLTTFIDCHRTTLECIELLNVLIEGGSVRLLLERLTLEHCAKLRRIHLGSLSEVRDSCVRPILFDRHQASEWTVLSSDHQDDNTITRHGPDLRTPITYHSRYR